MTENKKPGTGEVAKLRAEIAKDVPAIITTLAEPTTGNRARVQRYRAKHRRIEYVPSPDALAIIEAWHAHKLNNCMAGVIDRLILEGHKAMSGNAMSGNGKNG